MTKRPAVRFGAHKVQSVDILGQEVLNLIRWKVMDMRQKFVSQRTGVQSVDVLGQQVLKLIRGKVMDVRQKFVSQRTGVQSVDVLGQQVLKLIREKVMDMRQQCISERTGAGCCPANQEILGHALERIFQRTREQNANFVRQVA